MSSIKLHHSVPGRQNTFCLVLTYVSQGAWAVYAKRDILWKGCLEDVLVKPICNFLPSTSHMWSVE